MCQALKIVITGAAGFVGSHLAERLVTDGHEVTGIDSFVPYYPRAIKERNLAQLHDHERFTFVEADLRDADLVPLVEEADVVVHEAAMAGTASWDQFDLYVACNLTATQRLLEAIRILGNPTQRRLIQISTSSVYGLDARGNESTPVRPVSPYGISKLAAEQLALAYGEAFALPVVVLRYFSIYGPRQRPDMAYHVFIDALLRGQPVTILGDGEQSRGNTYIDDCVEGTVRAIEHGRAGEVYNIGGGVPITLNHALEIIERETGHIAERRYLPVRRGDQRHTLADTAKARADLGYEPRVGPEEGLRRQVAWQRSDRDASSGEPAER